MPTLYAGALWATRRWFKDNRKIVDRVTDTLEHIYREFGLKSRVAAPIIGRIVLYLLKKEEQRLLLGYTCEPPTLYENSVKAVRATKQVVHQPERIAERI